MDRKSFLIHNDSLNVLDDLSDEQCGKLFRAIKDYHTNKTNELDPLIKIAFSPFKNQFIRDTEKYENTCKARSIAGSKGGKQKVANASKSKKKVANLADSDSDSKNDSDGDSKKKKNKTLDYSLWPSIPDKQILDDWITMRKQKKASISQTVINQFGKQLIIAASMGYSTNECLSECITRNWQGFKAEWISGNNTQSAQPVKRVEF